MISSSTALAHPNIALIKYWGNRDDRLRLPMNGSISMNLDGLFTRTTVTWRTDQNNKEDTLLIDGMPINGKALQRVTAFLNLVRQLADIKWGADVVSDNNFPAGAGIASSSSAFAALAVAAAHAAHLDLDAKSLSRLARRGSGSACRSIPGGYVEWSDALSDEDSFAVTLATQEYWELVDVVAVVSASHKTTGSTEGHALAGTSPLQAARVADAPRRLAICRRAILDRDFSALAGIVETDSNIMHAVMMTSSPPLFYWREATLTVMQTVWKARADGLMACCTVDAGPNVHVICEKDSAEETRQLIQKIPQIQEIRTASVGGPAKVLTAEK